MCTNQVQFLARYHNRLSRYYYFCQYVANSTLKHRLFAYQIFICHNIKIMPALEKTQTRITEHLVTPPRSIDPTDFIGGRVISFKNATKDDALPPLSLQRDLITGVRAGDTAAICDFSDVNRGLVSSVVFTHQRYERFCLDDAELLGIATEGLTKAAFSYRYSDGKDFIDHAVSVINDALTEEFGDNGDPANLQEAEHPGANLIKYVFGLSVGPPKEATNKAVLKRLSSRQESVARLLVLPNEEIAATLGINVRNLNEFIRQARLKFGEEVSTPNNAGLGRLLHSKGVDLRILKPNKPLVEIFSNQDLEACHLIGLSYANAAKKLGMTKDQYMNHIIRMRERLGARSLLELALIVVDYDNGGRRDNDNRPPTKDLATQLGLTSLEGLDIEAIISDLTDKQQTAIRSYYIEGKTLEVIAQEHGVHRSAVFRNVRRGLAAAKKKIEAGEAASIEQAA